MKMSDRSAFSALSFIIVVVALLFYPGSTALALEEEHGNPGKFIENIRKGLSGLSKYFWSPKAQLPVESKELQAPDNKALAPVSKTPGADTSAKNPKADAKAITKVGGTKPAITSPAKDPATQKVISGKKPTMVQTIPKTAFESKTVIDRKKKMATPKKAPVQKKVTAKVSKPGSPARPVAKTKPAQKTTGPSLNVLSQPASQSQAIVQAQKKNAKQPAREKMSSLVTPQPIQKKKSQPQKSPKPAPAAKMGTGKKPVVSSTPKAAQKPLVKQPLVRKSAAASTKPVAPAIKKAPKSAMVAASPKAPKQRLVNNDKGTYIWVPNQGSQLSQRFGLTGIPAKGLAANSDLNRGDGRWIFAPNKPGQLPSIYGLSGEIHAAGDAGVWVGRGRNWVYVFDKGRNYGSIVGGTKTSKKAIAKPSKPSKPGKPVASLKPGGLNAQKSGKSDKPKKRQNLKKAEIKKPAKPQKGIEVKKTAKLADKRSQKQTLAKPVNKAVAKANAGPKTARNGKWSRVNNRWVYVPQAQPGQNVPSKMTGLAEQVAKAPITGGWVQRNNRWVYVAPRQGKARAGASGGNGSNKLQKGALGTVTGSKALMVPNKTLKKAGTKSMAKAPTTKLGIVIVQKPIVKKAPQPSAKTGLAEGPDATQPQVTKNQKIWVRKNNRWVYVFATPAAKSQRAQQAPKVKGPRMARNNSALQSAQKQGGVSPAVKKPLGQFMFFVPGRTPGTGSWFIAPLQLLEKARKIKRRSPGAGR